LRIPANIINTGLVVARAIASFQFENLGRNEGLYTTVSPTSFHATILNEAVREMYDEDSVKAYVKVEKDPGKVGSTEMY
jgi:hypothetical protein